MKTLSLWQPWASLIAMGLKKFETRHWDIAYRGPLAIHAAKRWTTQERNQWALFQAKCQQEIGWRPDPLPLGAVLCVVRLVDVYRTERIRPHLSEMELGFGNYAVGRFAWQLEMIEVFDQPIPARGAQGLFDWQPPSGKKYSHAV